MRDPNEGPQRRLSLLGMKELTTMIIDQKDGKLIIWGEGPRC
jgi:hypothetical protein